MFSNPRYRKSFIVAIIISLLVVLFVFGAQYANASYKAGTASQAINSNSTNSLDDDLLEAGVEWIDSYPGVGGNYGSYSCEGFYNHFINNDWKVNFRYGNEQVWERDYKSSIYGGHENLFPDNADIVMLCALGFSDYDIWNQEYLTAIRFPTAVNDFFLWPSEALDAYGDRDLEWLAFDASGMFADDSRDEWASTMNGLHLLIGYKNQAYRGGISIGDVWADRMMGDTGCVAPSSVTQSWFQAVDSTQDQRTCARILGERDDSFNDYLWGKGYVGSDTAIPNHYYYWDHCASGSDTLEISTQMNQPEVLAMQVVQVEHRTVDQNYVKNIVAPAFDFQDEDFCTLEDKFAAFRVLDGITQTLQIDRFTGSYSFYNLSKLWTTPVVPPDLPSADVSDVKINLWLHTPGGMLLPASGHDYRNAGWEFMREDIVGMNIIDGTEEEISRVPAVAAMTYPRKLAIIAVTTTGTQVVDFPIFGPGGRFKAYLGDEDEIIGVQGGSRDITVLAEQVQTLDPGIAWELFLADHSLAIGGMPYMADLITNSGIGTLGYYEMPYAMGQDYLIPVWMFMASFYSGGNTIATNVPIYLPAAMEYLPPTVEILNPGDGDTFFAGELISFEGGVLGGTPPYTYEWTSSSDGYLGDTFNIVSAIGSSIRSNTVFNPTVSFTVTDANGLTGTATISLAIKPIFWLSLIIR
jgi:hypothetical protein